jgi:hypothetical protein
MKISSLLEIYGFDTSQKIKLLRHKNKGYDLEEIYRRGDLNTYQSFQREDVFKNVKYLISFLGVENTKARFVGVFKINYSTSAKKEITKRKDDYSKSFKDDQYYYHLEEMNGFIELKDRLIIEWGKSTVKWHQWLIPNKKESDKIIFEILPKGYIRNFPGYEDFILSYDELVKLYENEDANRDWKQMLSSVAGIYLITDKSNGNQYVGSAYGKDGIWGRWKGYKKDGHANNVLLKSVKDKRQLTYTILRTLPRSITNKEIIAFETLYKNKLGTRAFGLNCN